MPQRIRSLLMAAAILAALWFNPPAGAADAPAVMYRGNPTHTGEYDGKGGFPAQRERWRFKTGNLNRSTPAVAAGVVYAGSHTGSLYAIDAATGTLKWQTALGGEIASSPAVAEGLVYVGNDAGFYALDAATGARQWTLPAGEIAPFNHRWDYYQSSPVVEAGVVYFGSGDGAIYAAEAKTGRVLWRYQTAGRVHGSHPPPGRVRVYVQEGQVAATLRRECRGRPPRLPLFPVPTARVAAHTCRRSACVWGDRKSRRLSGVRELALPAKFLVAGAPIHRGAPEARLISPPQTPRVCASPRGELNYCVYSFIFTMNTNGGNRQCPRP